jgi:hypothetical protein
MHQWKRPDIRQTAGSPMARIQFPEGLPGIRGPWVFRAEITKYISRKWPTTG